MINLLPDLNELKRVLRRKARKAKNADFMDQFDIYEDNLVLVVILMLHESFLLLSQEDDQN